MTNTSLNSAPAESVIVSLSYVVSVRTTGRFHYHFEALDTFIYFIMDAQMISKLSIMNDWCGDCFQTDSSYHIKNIHSEM